MPIAQHSLTNGDYTSNSETTSHTTGSISPTASRLVIAEVLAIATGGASPSAIAVTDFSSIITRAGSDGFTASWRHSILRYQNASPFSGTRAISFGGSSAAVCCLIYELSDVVTTGTNGADAIVQSAQNGGVSAAPSVSLGAFADGTNNATLLSIASYRDGGGSDTITLPSLTALTQMATYFSNAKLRGGWQIGQDTTPDAALNTSRNWTALAIEIAAAGGGGGAAASFIPGLRSRRLLTRI